MQPYKIITSGIDSEYVLGELVNYLRLRNYEVIELDFAHINSCQKALLRKLRNDKTLYITSAHTNLTLSLASYLAPTLAQHYPHYLAPLEILPLLQPTFSMYIPHDLLTPYGDSNLEEMRFLDLFTHILAATSEEQAVLSALLPETTQVHHAGWVKYTSDEYETEEINVLLFISMLEHLRTKYGVNGLVDYLKPLLKKGVKVKLPLWKDIQAVENAIKEKTEAEVIPSSVNSIALIKRANVVICNGASSIHAESALMGKPTICILDEEGASIAEQRKKLGSLPNMYFYDYRNKKPIPANFINTLSHKKSPTLLKPFNYEHILRIIEAS